MLNPISFGWAMGTVYAIWMAALALGATVVRAFGGMVSMYANVFPGYEASPRGSLIGALYGMVLGFGIGWGLASLYNAFLRMAPAAEKPTERIAAIFRR